MLKMWLKTIFFLIIARVKCMDMEQWALMKESNIGLNVLEIISRYGYPLERHTVETEDGYLLGVHRIPYGLKKDNSIIRQPVILVPGLLCSSADWVNMGPESSLGFMLADSGYDVWMVNPRGTTWSRKHKELDPDLNKEKFWDFSWHEIGYFDLPATIDYILRKTGEKQLYYVGHSQGTTTFFVMASMRSEYNKKIRLMQALAPVVYMSNIPNMFLREIAKFSAISDWLAKFIGLHEFLPHPELLKTVGKIVCSKNTNTPNICSNVLYLLNGLVPGHIDPITLYVILTNAPAGAATKQLLHYAQGVISGKFMCFDYGWGTNNKKYKLLTPPEYNLTEVTAPVALYYGANDQLVSVIDVALLAEKLPNIILNHLIPYKFTHGDFLWTKNATQRLYTDLIDMMTKY